MAKERAFMTRNTGTQEAPVWEKWFPKTVVDAVLVTDSDGETKNIKQYVDELIAQMIGGAPETANTLKELFELITSNNTIMEALNEAITNKADKDHDHADATQSAHGYLSVADKMKLDGIAANANNYTHPETHPATMVEQDINNRFVSDIEKSTWNGKADTAVATQSADGLMSKDDKKRLDGSATVYFGSDLPANAPTGAICFLIN